MARRLGASSLENRKMRDTHTSALAQTTIGRIEIDVPAKKNAVVDASEFSSRPTRVLLADDEALFVEALGLMLARDERIEVVGWARDGEEAIRLAETLQPDVVLMDIAIPVVDGVEASQRILAANSNVHVLLLTGGEGAADMTKAQEAGASGFITKNQAAAELTEAITEIAALASAFGGGERRRPGPGS